MKCKGAHTFSVPKAMPVANRPKSYVYVASKAPTGRARCRGCGAPIRKGSLRVTQCAHVARFGTSGREVCGHWHPEHLAAHAKTRMRAGSRKPCVRNIRLDVPVADRTSTKNDLKRRFSSVSCSTKRVSKPASNASLPASVAKKLKSVRFEVPSGGKAKYVAVIPESSGKTRRVAFGHRDYEHFRDAVPVAQGGGSWKHKDHGDPERRRRYRARHAGVKLGDGRAAASVPFTAAWFSWHLLW